MATNWESMEVFKNFLRKFMVMASAEDIGEKLLVSQVQDYDSITATCGVQDLSMYTTRVPKSIKKVNISETLDMICETNGDISYISMADDMFTGLSSEDKDIITDAKDKPDNTDMVDEFTQSQKHELLTNMYIYQSYLVGLVIVCYHVSAKLSDSVKFLNKLPPAPDPSSLTRPSQTSTTATSAPVKEDYTWFGDSWQLLTGISNRIKVIWMKVKLW